MGIITPPIDMSAISGGFLAKLFRNLSYRFNPDPKPAPALTLVPNGPPAYPYMSIQNATLYFHSQPLETPVYTPEVSFDLTQYSLQYLATAINQSQYGYTATAFVQDGTNASLLLGFTDFPLNGTDTINLQIATSNVWKFLYPISLAMQQADTWSSDGVENELNLPLARGFWLDFWGDWLNAPRIPGMSDLQYAAYLLLNLKAPRSNNAAIEDLLKARYQVPVTVVDSGPYQFMVNLDASVMGTVSQADLSSLVNKIKAAGIQWLTQYLSSFSENYTAYFVGRKGHAFTSSDTFDTTLDLSEGAYRYNLSNLFMFNHGMFNDTPVGTHRLVQDALLAALSLSESHQWKTNTDIVTQEIFSASFTDWYESYFSARNGEPFSTSDAVSNATLSMTESVYRFNFNDLFLFNLGMFNDTPVGTHRLVQDTYTMSGALNPTASETYVHISSNSTLSFFGTSGGKLVSPFNGSLMRSGLKEAVTMYYNSPHDPSFTLL